MATKGGRMMFRNLPEYPRVFRNLPEYPRVFGNLLTVPILLSLSQSLMFIGGLLQVWVLPLNMLEVTIQI